MRYLAALLLAVPCGPVTVLAQGPSDEQAIRRLRAESNRAIARHDVPGILAFMEGDVHVAASTGAFFTSREQMGAAFAARFAESPDAVYERTAETVELSASGPFASETGFWEGRWSTPAGPLRTGGRYAAYWRKSQGAWRIHAELYVPLYCEGDGCGGGDPSVDPPLDPPRTR